MDRLYSSRRLFNAGADRGFFLPRIFLTSATNESESSSVGDWSFMVGLAISYSTRKPIKKVVPSRLLPSGRFRQGGRPVLPSSCGWDRSAGQWARILIRSGSARAHHVLLLHHVPDVGEPDSRPHLSLAGDESVVDPDEGLRGQPPIASNVCMQNGEQANGYNGHTNGASCRSDAKPEKPLNGLNRLNRSRAAILNGVGVGSQHINLEN